MLSLRAKVEIAAAIVLLVGGVLAFRSWLSQHDLRLHAEETAKAQQAVQSDAKQQIAGLQKQMADREAAYQVQLKLQGTKFSNSATPAQLAQLASQVMKLQQPIQLQTPPASAANPQPEVEARVPQIDFPQAKSYIEACESCKLERDKLVEDVNDRAAQAALAGKQIVSLQQEVATWKNTANGGNWWLRTKRAAKWLIIGGAAGGAALCGTGHCKL